MMFFEPTQLITDLPPSTRTGKLLVKVEGIKEQISDGNTIRYITGVNASVAVAGLVLGSTALSPFVSLLFLVGASSATASYIAYALFEASKLKINPVWFPTMEGEVDQVLAEILPMQERLLWIAIDNFGEADVETLEYTGHLDYLLRSIKGIKVRSTETAVEDFQNAIQQIGNHYFPQSPQLNTSLPTRKTQLPPVAQKANRQSLPPTPSEPIDDSADVWEQPVTASRSPIVENYEDDLNNPVYDDPSSSEDDWSILDTVKKSNQELISTKNLALDIAENVDSHFCFVAEPRVGKSSLLISTIERIKGDVYFVDCKGDDLRFRNLKKVNPKARYMQVNEEKSLTAFFELLEAIVQTMIARQSNLERSPITFVIDEINILINIINSYEAETGDKNIFSKFKGKMMRILAQGLSSGIRLVFTTHTTKVVELFGTSTALQSVTLIGLGKIGKTKAMNDCIDFKIRPRHRDAVSEKVEIALANNDGAVMALLCDTTPPEIINIPFVDYNHLLQGISAKQKQPSKEIKFPVFEDESDDTPEPSIESIPEQPSTFTPNDLLAWLEKRPEGHYNLRAIQQSTKFTKAEIELAAEGLYKAGHIELENWRQPNGRQIAYFKEIQESPKYNNNVIPFTIGVV